MARLVVRRVPIGSCARVLAAWRRARLDARLAVRAMLTARLHGLPCKGLAVEALRCSSPAALDELAVLALVAVRLAAEACGEPAEQVLAELLFASAAVDELEPAGGEG